MDNHQYTEVPTNVKEDVKENNSQGGESRKYFLRQMYVSSVMWTSYFASGIMLGTPTIYIPQARREANSTTAISVEMVSWLSSAFANAAVPWCIVLSFLLNFIGRKKTVILISFNQLLVATSLYFTVTPVHMLITEVFHGLTHASATSVCVIFIAEYVAPKNRGLMMTIKSATVYWAILATNAIGTYFPWRYITVLSFTSSIYSMTAVYLPESPTWLATRGRYEECRKSHRWLKGCSESSEKELELLISTQIEEQKVRQKKTLRNCLNFIVKKDFYLPIILSSIMMGIYNLSGKTVVTIYAIDIIKKITSSESTAYRTMLILDAVSVLAMYVGCFLCKVLKRRVMLFTFGGSSVVFLFVLSLYLYLVHLSYISENKYISVVLLVGFSVAIGLGPIILATSVYGELLCVKYQSQSAAITGCIFLLLQWIMLKNTPYIFKYFDMHGMFLFYGISVTVCLLILYIYLPETKDKTLQEIQRHFKD